VVRGRQPVLIFDLGACETQLVGQRREDLADETVYVTNQDNSRYAIAAATGDERWADEIGATLVGSPAVADGTGYVGTAGNAIAALREP